MLTNRDVNNMLEKQAFCVYGTFLGYFISAHETWAQHFTCCIYIFVQSMDLCGCVCAVLGLGLTADLKGVSTDTKTLVFMTMGSLGFKTDCKSEELATIALLESMVF